MSESCSQASFEVGALVSQRALPSCHSEAMSLKPFTYPFPETRFLHSGSNVYKFKIRYGNRVRREDIENKEVIVQELEDSIRVVLGNLDNLQPFTTKHFIVFPYKSRWERVSHLKFKHGEVALVPYPFVLTLYVEMKWFHENLSPGKPINDSALGLVLTEREAAGAMRKKRKRTEVSSSPSRPGLDRAKVRTSSEGPSKKKLLVETSRVWAAGLPCAVADWPMECPQADRCPPLPSHPFEREEELNKYKRSTRSSREQRRSLQPTAGRSEFHIYADCKRNRERKTQQECQETSAFGVTDVQEQDSRWEDSQAGDVILPGQQSSPPPPEGPADLGASGILGFLSSVFPFRYFFRRSSQ